MTKHLEEIAESRQYMDDRFREQISHQPYRTNPLVIAGAKISGNNSANHSISYLTLHPDPQVREYSGSARRVGEMSRGLLLHNDAGARSVTDAVTSGQEGLVFDPSRGKMIVVPVMVETQAGYSTDNQQVRPSKVASAVKSGGKDFSLANSEALKMVLEEEQGRPEKLKQKVITEYDVHEAKRGVWPPPDLRELRAALPPLSERPQRQMVEQPNRDLPDAPAETQISSMYTKSGRIAQSYSFNKLMWSVGMA